MSSACHTVCPLWVVIFNNEVTPSFHKHHMVQLQWSSTVSRIWRQNVKKMLNGPIKKVQVFRPSFDVDLCSYILTYFLEAQTLVGCLAEILSLQSAFQARTRNDPSSATNPKEPLCNSTKVVTSDCDIRMCAEPHPLKLIINFITSVLQLSPTF